MFDEYVHQRINGKIDERWKLLTVLNSTRKEERIKPKNEIKFKEK